MAITYVDVLDDYILIPSIARLIESYIDPPEIINPKHRLQRLWDGVLASKIPSKPTVFDPKAHHRYHECKNIIYKLGARLLSAPDVALQLSRLYCYLYNEPMPCRKRRHNDNQLSTKSLCFFCRRVVYTEAHYFRRTVYCHLCLERVDILERLNYVLGVPHPFYVRRTQVRSTEIPLREFQYLQEEEPSQLILAAKEIHTYYVHRMN